MKDKLPRVSPVAMMQEVGEADLGDERLNSRLAEIMGALSAQPDSPFARLFEDENDVEAVYRFMRNPLVDWEDVLEPHAEETARRCDASRSVVVIHDTTTNRISDNAHLNSYINTGKKGFFTHASLAVDNNDSGRPLGILALQCHFRSQKQSRTKTKKGRKLSGAETAKLKKREFDRWAKGVDMSEQRLNEGVDVVHVMDREGDSFGLLGGLITTGKSFVVRECKNRRARLAGSDADEWNRLHDLLDKAKRTRIRRRVHLGRRDKKSAPGAAKANPARPARSADLRVAYMALEIKAPLYLKTSTALPESVRINIVHVRESNPPPNVKRIEWVLLTNLPVKNAQQAQAIVDIYCRRWLIEEFFAALKGGCRYRERRLTNRFSILTTLATLVPVAWKVLDLRHLARTAGNRAVEVFDSLQMDALRAKARQMKRPLGRHPTAEQALQLIARIGGHRKSSGPPGWRSLMKGMDRFLGIVEGYALANEKM